MNIIEAILLGLLQGLTEFLPISSTGHLTLAGKLFGVVSESSPEKWTAFIAVVQLGTLIAVLIYFWFDIWDIVIAFFKENVVSRKKYSAQTLNSKLGWLIIIGTLPVVVIGLGFKDVIEGALTKNLEVIAASLIGLAIVLALAEKTSRFKKELKDLTWFDALMIGIAQTMALIPGSSRSGTTITAGLFLGLKRETAARFSFLLSIPAVFASGILEFYQALEYLDFSGIINIVIATIAAAISGYMSIEFLLRFLRKNSTMVFVFYRILIGITIFILIWNNLINS
ncbi:MAG: undecaprenyl-diphosphatase UppP [Bacteroidetes bacterium]|nr:undecaprenyl-diphosphatase UppP [Bacteroidota bacterium]